MRVPNYSGSGLVNLVSELERRLGGAAPMPGLARPDLVPDAAGYVLVLFDGLGTHQLDGPGLAEAQRATLSAGFATTTTTSLSTVATGLPPAGHGIIGHLARLPGVAEVVNVLKWVTPGGQAVEHDYASVLPSPNLWERLRATGVEPITVQPGSFTGSPLSRMLYRGCRFEGAWNEGELIQATLDLAGPGRLVLAYYPNVDVAAHVHGQSSRQYRRALAQAGHIWDQLTVGLPAEIGLVGTSDHGHVDYGHSGKHLIRDRWFDPLLFYGDSRSLCVKGPAERIEDLTVETGATRASPAEFRPWLGPGPAHPDLESRLPDAVLLAPPGRLLLPRGFDKRLIGYHGGLTPAEVDIPILARL